jgi:hypothetical protein
MPTATALPHLPDAPSILEGNERRDHDAKPLSTAELIRSMASPRPQPECSGNRAAGMSATAAVELVRSMAAAPGHPCTHVEDIGNIYPLLGMFTAGMAPQHTSQSQPGPLGLLGLLVNPQQDRSQPSIGPQLVSLPKTPGTSPNPSDPRAPPKFLEILNAPPVPLPVNHDSEVPAQPRSPPDQSHSHKQPTLQAANAINGEGATHPDWDEALLDVLTATMDAWEQAVTSRLTAAVHTAVAAARADVFQVSDFITIIRRCKCFNH